MAVAMMAALEGTGDLEETEVAGLAAAMVVGVKVGMLGKEAGTEVDVVAEATGMVEAAAAAVLVGASVATEAVEGCTLRSVCREQ